MSEIYNNPVSPGIGHLPPPGSVEYDMEMALRSKIQKERYKDSVSRYSDKPQLFANPSATPKKAGFSADFDAFCDWVYEQFWGKPEDKKSDKQDTPGTPVNPTPRLASPNSPEMSKAHLHKLLKALDEMTRYLQQIQEASKEEIIDATSVDEARALYAFLALLKKQGEIKKDEQILSHEGISELHQKMQADQQARTALQTAVEKSQSAGNVASVAGVVSGLLLAVASVIQILKWAGYMSGVGAPLAAASELLTVGILGLNSVATTLKTKYQNDFTEQNTELMRLSHNREDQTHQTKDFSYDMKLVSGSIINQTRTEAEELQKYTRMLEHVRSLSN